MSDRFDPYYTWLGIPPAEQPANHYRLLGISLFESNTDAISNAADRVMTHVRTYQAGKHGKESQQILNEVAAARVTLLSAEKKARYDSELQATIDNVRAGSSSVLDDAPVIRTSGNSRVGGSSRIGRSGSSPKLQDTVAPFDTSKLPNVGKSKSAINGAMAGAATTPAAHLDDTPVSSGPQIVIAPRKKKPDEGTVRPGTAVAGQGKAKSKLPLWIGLSVGGVALAGVVGVAIILGMGRPAPEPVAEGEVNPTDVVLDTSGSDDSSALPNTSNGGTVDEPPRSFTPSFDPAVAGQPEGSTGSETSTAQHFSPPTVSPASWHDLLTSVDPSVDRFFGDWQVKPSAGLQCSPPQTNAADRNAPRNALLALPTAPTGEYQLRIKLECVSGDNAVVVVVPVARQQVAFSIGARVGGKVRSGFENIAGKRLDANPAWTSTIHTQKGTTHQLDVIVLLPPTPPATGGSPAPKPTAELYALWDGAPAAHWKGLQEHLSALSEFSVPGEAAICLGSAGTTVRFESVYLGLISGDVRYRRDDAPKLAINPLPQPGAPAASYKPEELPPEGIDVLSRFDPNMHATEGAWTREGRAVVSSGGNPSTLHLPIQPPSEYRVETVVERMTGLEGIKFHMVTPEASFDVVIGDRRGCWIRSVDGKDASADNPSLQAAGFITSGQPTRVRCDIRKEGVQVWMDGKVLIDWRGDRSRLSCDGHFNVLPDRYSLGVGMRNTSQFKLHEYRVLPIDAPENAGLPTPDAIAAAQEKIRAQLRAEYDAAKRPDQMLALAQALLEEAESAAGDATLQIAAWDEARQWAARAENAPLALGILRQRHSRYPLDLFATAAATVSEIDTKNMPLAMRRESADLANDLATEAIAADRHDAALTLLQFAIDASSKLKDGMSARLDDRKTRLGRMKTEYVRLSSALETLKTNAGDPAANLAVGRYECFFKDDWASGLPKLAQSGDAKLQAAAEQDLRAQQTAATRLEIADKWFEIGNRLSGDAKTNVLRRAGEFYLQALPGLPPAQHAAIARKIDTAILSPKSAGNALVAHWTFDEGEGRLAKDYSGKKRHVVLHNAGWTRGVHGGALALNGPEAFAQFPPIGSATKWTLSLWVRLDELQREGGLFTTTDNLSGHLHLLFQGDGIVRGDIRDSAGGNTRSSLQPGQWHHIALRFDNKCDLFFDGQLEAGYGANRDRPPIIGPGRIGGWVQDDPNRGIYGAIDDVRLYGGLLSNSEIAALAQQGQQALQD